MVNLWRKKITKQGHNYSDRKCQVSFEIRRENLETPIPPAVVRSLLRKKGNLNNWKSVFFEDSDEDSSGDEQLSSRKKFHKYHRKCSHSMDEKNPKVSNKKYQDQ